HFTRLTGQEKINVVSLPIRRFHVHAREIFPATEVLQAIVVHLYQVQSEILSLMFNVKLAIGGVFGFDLDVLFYSSGNISRAHVLFGSAFLRVFGALFWLLCGFLRMFGMLLGTDRRCRGEE